MRDRSRPWFIAAFLAPALLIYGGLVLYPLGQAFAFSAYRWRGVSAVKTYVGAQNFIDLTHDDAFRKAIQNNLWLLVVGGLLTVAISIGLAHAMGSQGRTGRALRATILIPQVIPVVVVAILWMFLFNPQFGLLTSGLKAVGLGGWVKTWLGDPNTALPAVTVAFVWYAMGFYSLLFSAGLKALPQEVFEAAELDGASPWRKFSSVSWPMLWSTKRTVYVHLTITVMNVFALVLIMTQGGPDRATETMLTYLYENAFKNFQFGYATAIAVVNFVVVMSLGGLILFITRRDPQGVRH